jgi:hypothetical protein
MKNIEFSRDLIKGKIAEIIFEQMFRVSGKFTILRFGYEYTQPELAQYQYLTKIKTVLENIRTSPDFILISQNKKEVYLVEVKYRSRRIESNTKKIAEGILETWNPSWLFIASPDGFFFEPCHTIVANKGKIGSLYTKWVDKKTQLEYLKLLKEFEVGCK